MNFDPTIPTNIAVVMSLLAAFMWGTWYIAVKYLGDYPLDAFYITLFTTSLVLVWGVGLLLDGGAIFRNISQVWAVDPSRVYVTLICGALYVVGMQLSLRVFQIIGLSLSQPLQSSINLIGGILISALIGGIPADLTISRIALAAVFLLAAIFLTLKAGNIRDRAQGISKIDTGLSRDPKVIRRAVIMLFAASLFVPAYTLGLSYGLRSITQPNGMAVMPFMAMLCTGAFIGAMLMCGTSLTVKRQWHVFREYGFNIHKLGILSGLAHYGGNIIHTFATRSLSSVVSWPLGLTMGLWTQMWGLVYGEFRGSPRITYAYLFTGILFYLIGALLIANI